MFCREEDDGPGPVIILLTILLALLFGLFAPDSTHGATTTPIRNLTADTAPASGDMLLVDKATPLTTRKLTLSTLTSYIQGLGVFLGPSPLYIDFPRVTSLSVPSPASTYDRLFQDSVLGLAIKKSDGSVVGLESSSTPAIDVGLSGGGAGTYTRINPGTGITTTDLGDGIVQIASSGGGSGTVTSVGASVPPWLAVTGSPVTTSGTLVISAASGQAAGRVVGTCGAGTSVSLCALTAGMVPTLNQSTTGNASTATTLAANGSNCSAGSFPLGVDASGAAESCTALPTSIAGTVNQIAVSSSTGSITISIPNSPILPGTTTGTFSGNLTGNVTGNASTATSAATATTLSAPLSVGLGGTGLSSVTDDATLIGNGTTWQARTIPDCTDMTGNHLNYTQSTNTLSCGTSSGSSSSSSFTTIAPSSGSSPVASSSTDTLNIVAGIGITVAGNSSTKTITITAIPVNNWTTVYKTSSQTVTNSSTPAADSLLTITLSTVGTYEFTIHVFASDTSPGNAEGFKATLGGTASMASLTATAKLFCTFNGTLCDIERWTNFGSIVATNGESLPDLEVTGTFEVQTPGTFYLSWSQNSSLVATSVSVLRGSTLSYRAIP